jgi:hypothetical protein
MTDTGLQISRKLAFEASNSVQLSLLFPATLYFFKRRNSLMSNAEQQRIVEHFVLSAPSGQVKAVVAGSYSPFH